MDDGPRFAQEQNNPTLPLSDSRNGLVRTFSQHHRLKLCKLPERHTENTFLRWVRAGGDTAVLKRLGLLCRVSAGLLPEPRRPSDQCYDASSGCKAAMIMEDSLIPPCFCSKLMQSVPQWWLCATESQITVLFFFLFVRWIDSQIIPRRRGSVAWDWEGPS